jgi:hypothetical protein
MDAKNGNQTMRVKGQGCREQDAAVPIVEIGTPRVAYKYIRGSSLSLFSSLKPTLSHDCLPAKRTLKQSKQSKQSK